MDVAMEKVEAAASAGEPRLMDRLSAQRRVEVAAEVERQVSARLLAEREEAADAAISALVDGPVGPVCPPERKRPKTATLRGSAAQAPKTTDRIPIEEALALDAASTAARQSPGWVGIDPVRFEPSVPFPCGKPLVPTPPSAPPPSALLGMMPTRPKAPPKDSREEEVVPVDQVEEGEDDHEARRTSKASDGGAWRVPPTPPPPPPRRAQAMDLEGPSSSSAQWVPPPPAPVPRPKAKVAVTHNQIQRARAKTDEVLKAKLASYGDEKKRIKEARRSWIGVHGPEVPVPKALMPRLPDGRLAAVDMTTGASLNVPYCGPELLY